MAKIKNIFSFLLIFHLISFSFFSLDINRTKAAPVDLTVVNSREFLNGLDWWPSISGDGNTIVFGTTSGNLVNNDNNNADDVYVFDRTSGLFDRPGVNLTGDIDGWTYTTFEHAVSDNGRYVVYSSCVMMI